MYKISYLKHIISILFLSCPTYINIPFFFILRLQSCKQSSETNCFNACNIIFLENYLSLSWAIQQGGGGVKQACTLINDILDSFSSIYPRSENWPEVTETFYSDFQRANVVTQNMVIVDRRLMSPINPHGAWHSSSYLSWLSRVYRRQNAAALVNDVKYGRP